MEGNIFLSKLMFAVLVWLVVTFNVSANMSSLSSYVTNVTQHTNYSLNQLYHSLSLRTSTITEKLLPAKQVSNIVVPKDDLKCMSENIYYEAGNQSYVGKIAVGQVVLNRVKTPGYPDTVCKVIYEGLVSERTTVCQFSWLCDDGRKGINKTSQNWMQSVKAATELLTKRESLVDLTEGATNYHANYVSPGWSKQLHFVTQIDQHLFYRKR